MLWQSREMSYSVRLVLLARLPRRRSIGKNASVCPNRHWKNRAAISKSAIPATRGEGKPADHILFDFVVARRMNLQAFL